MLPVTILRRRPTMLEAEENWSCHDKQYYQAIKGASSMNAIYDATDTNSVLQLAWPLPGTMLPHAHPTWDEWVTRIVEEPSSVFLSAIRTAGSEPDSIRYLE